MGHFKKKCRLVQKQGQGQKQSQNSITKGLIFLVTSYSSKIFPSEGSELSEILSLQDRLSGQSDKVGSTASLHCEVLWADCLINIKIVKGRQFDKLNWAEGLMAYILEWNPFDEAGQRYHAGLARGVPHS